MMHRQSAIWLSLTALVFAGGWSFTASPAEDAYKACRNGGTNQLQACIETLVAMPAEGLPYLDKLLTLEEERPSGAHRMLTDAVVRIGTEEAADVLMIRAQRYRTRIGYGDVTPELVNALARMGNKGLNRLVILSKQTESYREPWFAPEWRAEKFIWFPKKQWRPTHAAGAARAAVALVRDPGAVSPLVALIDMPELRDSALLALAAMKAKGAEEKAVRNWENDRNPVALKYLMAVDREKYLYLLRDKLKLLDDELAGRLGDSDWIVEVVYELGGERIANETLKRYVESKAWVHPYRETPVAFAVLALGRSGDPAVKETLLGLLKDSSQITVSHTHSLGLPGLYMGSGRGFGTPMSMVAVKALEELRDPAVIPAIEQHMAIVLPAIEQEEMNKGKGKRFFDNVLTTLRNESKTNQTPEDTARKLADPQS